VRRKRGRRVRETVNGGDGEEGDKGRVDMTRARKSNEEVVGVRRVSEVDARGSVNTKVCSNERERE
jgi:hypothetical protein